MIHVVTRILGYELRQISRGSHIYIKAPFFFFMLVTLTRLSLPLDITFQGALAGGTLIIAVLLSCLLSVNGFFETDYKDHSLDQILTGSIPAGFYIFIKFIAHWLMAAAPLVILGPFVAWIFDAGAPAKMLLSILAASMLFILIALLGAALTLKTKQSGLLLALIVLPLYIPVLIFASLASQSGIDSQNAQAALLFLYAILAPALPGVPVICSAILKMQVQ